MKTISLKEFQALHLELNEYKKKQIAEETARAKEISAFHPCEIFFVVSEQDGKLYFEHTNLKLSHKTLDVSIRYSSYEKRYSIYCDSIRNLKNITSYTVSDEGKKLVEPKNIGVLTTKKINDWLNYYEQLYKNLEAINGGNDDKEKKFLDSLKGLDVKFYNNGKSGEVIKNGIKFSFKIEPSYISQKIEVYYEAESNLNTFLQLSDNKYGKKIHY